MVSDLPDPINTLAGAPRASLVEAVGYDGAQLLVDQVALGSTDAFSAHVQLLRPNNDGSLAYSTERWLRLESSAPVTRILGARFWVADFDPDPDWELAWGLSAQYQQPARSESNLAVNDVPTDDPGVGNLGSAHWEGASLVTDWLVLQAQWISGAPGPMQVLDPTLHFAWTEV